MIPLGVLASSRVAPISGTIDYLGAASTGTDASTHTYSGVPFGTAATGRQIIVCVNAGSAPAQGVSTVTIGGVSATIDTASANGNGFCAIARATVPTGASGTVVITYTGNVSRSFLSSYSAPSTAAPAATATVTGDGSSSSVASASITNPSGGIVVATAYTYTSAVSWTGATQDHATTIETVWGTSARTTVAGALTLTATATATAFDAIAAVAYTT